MTQIIKNEKHKKTPEVFKQNEKLSYLIARFNEYSESSLF